MAMFPVNKLRKHPHKGTGKVRRVWLTQDENLTPTQSHIQLEKGKIKHAVCWLPLAVGDGRAIKGQEQIALEYDQKKRQFFYVVDVDGTTFSDWEYWNIDRISNFLRSFTSVEEV
jgi:hypothetical protein